MPSGEEPDLGGGELSGLDAEPKVDGVSVYCGVAVRLLRHQEEKTVSVTHWSPSTSWRRREAERSCSGEVSGSCANRRPCTHM